MNIRSLLPKQFVAGVKSCDKQDARNSVYKLSYHDGSSLFAKLSTSTERSVLEQLQEFSFVPSLLHDDPASSLILLSSMPGQPLSLAAFDHAKESLTKHLALVHQCSITQQKDLQRLTDRLLTPKQMQQLPADLKYRYINAVSVTEEKQYDSLLHGDFVPNNIIVDGVSCAIIDWEYACFGNPMWDIAAIAVELGLDISASKSLVEEYLQQSKLDGSTLRDTLPQWLTLYAIICFDWSSKQPNIAGYSSDRYLSYLDKL